MQNIDKLTIILKPTNACNMRCVYCYHAEKGYENTQMRLSTFEDICKKTIPYVKNLTIIWHGGEPLLMGLDFFEKTMLVLDDYGSKYNTNINVSIQTNGTLLNQQWADFIKLHNIKMGLSFDGIDNEYTRGHTNEILRAFKVLQAYSIKFGVIQVLNANSINKIYSNYEFYKDLKIGVKFNYIFETGLVKGDNDMLLSPSIYVKNISEFFDYWLYDTSCRINVNPMLEYVRLFYKKPSYCTFNSCMFKYLSINASGDIYPCGRNYSSEYAMGRIDEYENILHSFYSDGYKLLLTQAVDRRRKCANHCNFYALCCGGCNSDKIIENEIGECGGFSCQTFIGVMQHVVDKLSNISNISTHYNPTFIQLAKRYN